MFTHPCIGSQLAREHHRDMLAQADQQRLARQLRGHARASRRAARTEPGLRRALRTALRLRPAAGATTPAALANRARGPA